MGETLELGVDCAARKAYVTPEQFARIKEEAAKEGNHPLSNIRALRAVFSADVVDLLARSPHIPVEIVVVYPALSTGAKG